MGLGIHGSSRMGGGGYLVEMSCFGMRIIYLDRLCMHIWWPGRSLSRRGRWRDEFMSIVSVCQYVLMW